MDIPSQIAYSTKANVSGGRDGYAKSEDGKLDIKLSTPKALGGNGGDGTNPEQLFAAGYAACFIGAMKFVAAGEKIDLSNDLSIESEVGIGPIEGGFAITVSLTISEPSMEKNSLLELVGKAHQVCPYSNATRDNVDVKISVD